MTVLTFLQNQIKLTNPTSVMVFCNVTPNRDNADCCKELYRVFEGKKRFSGKIKLISKITTGQIESENKKGLLGWMAKIYGGPVKCKWINGITGWGYC